MPQKREGSPQLETVKNRSCVSALALKRVERCKSDLDILDKPSIK